MSLRISLLIMLIVAGILALVACQQQAAEPSEASAMMMAEAETMMAEAEAMMEEAEGMMAEGTMAEDSGASRLETVKARGNLICASNNSLAGFGAIDANGNTVGFDIDLCRAVAAAVLGNADSVEFRPTVAAERGPTMQSGEVDLMSRNTTWTSSRDAQ